MILAACRSASKAYGERVIFRNVSLSLEPGTVTLLTGPNGAGKSTLLRVFAGLARLDAGQMERTVEKQDVAYLGHATFLYPALTAWENLLFWLRLFKKAEPEARAEAALRRTGLSGAAEEKAGRFSRGMAQRLNLARVLAQEPKLLLLDEPGTGLDERSVALLHAEIAAARARNAAVLWVSHALEQDRPHADKVVRLADRGLREEAS